MVRQIRKWHPKFKEYMEFIVKHPNYAGMPFPYKKDGSIRWIVASGKLRDERAKWWDKKKRELGLSSRAEVARKIHPKELKGMKPCQICGKEMSIHYIYPTKRKGVMSPGVMSNAPDRFDGFHTYNICCRSKEDTGRYKTNLARYGEDRRAYENWAEGDWKASSWLMKKFNQYGVSADHIGPLSIGFCHRPKFRPMTKSENAKKNRRMTYEDVKMLIADEKKDEQVVSWHSKYIWDNIKNLIKSDNDAIKLSDLMRKNLHYVLTILSEIAKKGFKKFLIKNFLHPEYAYYSIEFIGFNPKTGEYTELRKIKGSKKQYEKNAKRYIRISFESLKKYRDKKNRRIPQWKDKKVDELLNKVILNLSIHQEKQATKFLNQTLKTLADKALEEYQSKK